jgi:transposase
MIHSKSLKADKMAAVAGCSKRSIYAINRNLRCFGSTKAPSNVGGRPRSITSAMLDALYEYLEKDPSKYLYEMVNFLQMKFEVSVTTSSVRRALVSIGWTKKQIRRVAKGRNADLRDTYLYNISDISPEHFVFVDESGCDRRVGLRRTGWSPLGVTPTQVAPFQREQRYQILPAYAVDGIMLAHVFQGSTDGAVFEDFIEQLLPLCGKWPEPKSVLVMDNASFHHTERITQMCYDAGVKLLYLPPYSPDLNPIEEFFAELKAFIKRNWHIYEGNPEQGFGNFLEWCIDVVGAREQSAEGHFRHAGLTIEKL